LAACAGAHIPVIIDLEHDFEQLPATHPAYAEFGLSSVEKTRVYTAAILLAERITTPSRCLAEKVETEGRKVSVVPHGWMMRNGLWQKPASRRHTVNLGWIGAAGEVEDVAEIRRMVLRVLREFPQSQLVIGGDAQVYQLFERLPESRRLFLPPVSMEDYPYLLGQVDILLAPMRETLYNQMRSDRRLMEAGARRIPWIASPIPAFLEWKVGGLIARTPEEWIDHLRQLILDADMRASLGQEGWKKAEGREINAVGDVWQRLIEGTLEKARKKV